MQPYRRILGNRFGKDNTQTPSRGFLREFSPLQQFDPVAFEADETRSGGHIELDPVETRAVADAQYGADIVDEQGIYPERHFDHALPFPGQSRQRHLADHAVGQYGRYFESD